MEDARGALRRIAAKQHGAFTRRQALAVGMTRHTIATAVRHGDFIARRRGTFVLAGTPNTWEQSAMVEVLAAGPGAAVAGVAAAYLLGIVERRSDRVEVVVPHDRRPRGRRRLTSLPRADTRRVRGIPVTCPGRTLVDLAASAADDILEEAVDNTLDSGLASVDGLRRYLRTRRLEAVAGVGRLTALVHDRARYGIPRSKLERKLVRLFDRFGIPQPVRQYPVGGRRLDFAYPEQMVAIEVDGRRDHAKKTVFEEDRRRQNEIVLAGWTVLRFTWDDVTKRPATVAEATRQGLASTGGGS